jgi:hypothetical protein
MSDVSLGGPLPGQFRVHLAAAFSSRACSLFSVPQRSSAQEQRDNHRAMNRARPDRTALLLARLLASSQDTAILQSLPSSASTQPSYDGKSDERSNI